MVWVIVVLALVVLGLGAWAGTGRLGEMPEVVNDRPKGVIPEGPVDEDFLHVLQLPRASTGYDRAQVDAYLSTFVDGAAPGEALEAAFDVVAGGYDMQAVDAVLDRLAHEPIEERQEVPPDGDPEVAEPSAGEAGSESSPAAAGSTE